MINVLIAIVGLLFVGMLEVIHNRCLVHIRNGYDEQIANNKQFLAQLKEEKENV